MSQIYIKENHLKRWENCYPGPLLTDHYIINGDEFISSIEKYVNFSFETSILELGPGYGRLLKSFLDKQLSFKKYVGIDISKNNIDFLKNNFKHKNIEFIHSTFLNATIDSYFDVIYSSLVLKHQFPTFFESLKHIIKFMKKDGILFFDLPIPPMFPLESDVNCHKLITTGPVNYDWFESTQTFVGKYSLGEIQVLCKELGLTCDFDFVNHQSIGRRLLIICRQRGD